MAAEPHGSLHVPPARQGPGPIPAALVEALSLSIARRGAGVLPGDRVAPGVGSGTELAQLRPYQLGDDVRQLDPAASARTGTPHVRLQVPERILTTWLVLDVSASMAFGTADRLKSDVAEGVAHVVGARRDAPRRPARGAHRRRRADAAAARRAAREDRPAQARRVRRRGRRGERSRARVRCCTRSAASPASPGSSIVVTDFRGERDWQRPLRALGGAPPGARDRDPRPARGAPGAGRAAVARRSRDGCAARGRHVAPRRCASASRRPLPRSARRSRATCAAPPRTTSCCRRRATGCATLGRALR